jgi:hypothetical protein
MKTNNTTPEDFWSADDFEDTVAAALIATFETKVKKNRGACPSDRLNDARIATIRSVGPYIGSSSRLVQTPGPDGKWSFDVLNDPLPDVGLIATRPSGKLAESLPDAYLAMNYIRRAPALGKNWHARAAGTIYEMLTMDAGHYGIAGERRFFTVTRLGNVWACDQRVSTSKGVNSHPPSYLSETEAWACVTMQTIADRRFCWTITAQEHMAHAHLGCMQEEVKSLLYARTLPMTSTGRKRPILHLVEAHKRRMKNGTDIDISSFLRGQQVVEIDGTRFKVNPPTVLVPNLSENSARFFK